MPGRGQTVVAPMVTSLWDLRSLCQRELWGWCRPSGKGSWRQAGISLGPSILVRHFRRSASLAGVLDGVHGVSGALSPLSVPGPILGGIGGVAEGDFCG